MNRVIMFIKKVFLIVMLIFFVVAAYAVKCPGISDWQPHVQGKDFELTEDAFNRGWRYDKDNPNIAIVGALPPHVMVMLRKESDDLYCDYKFNNEKIISIHNVMQDFDPATIKNCDKEAPINAQICTWEWKGHD